MHDTIQQDEPVEAQAEASPKNGDGDQPGPAEKAVPFPPDSITNGTDIRNLYGLYWLSKS